jgi:hypothetical protein
MIIKNEKDYQFALSKIEMCGMMLAEDSELLLVIDFSEYDGGIPKLTTPEEASTPEWQAKIAEVRTAIERMQLQALVDVAAYKGGHR